MWIFSGKLQDNVCILSRTINYDNNDAAADPLRNINNSNNSVKNDKEACRDLIQSKTILDITHLWPVWWCVAGVAPSSLCSLLRAESSKSAPSVAARRHAGWQTHHQTQHRSTRRKSSRVSTISTILLTFPSPPRPILLVVSTPTSFRFRNCCFHEELSQSVVCSAHALSHPAPG